MKHPRRVPDPKLPRRQTAPDSTFWVKRHVWIDKKGKTVSEETTDYRDYLYVVIEILIAAGLWFAQASTDGWLRILIVVIACVLSLHALITAFAIIGARAASHYLDREIRAIKGGDHS